MAQTYRQFLMACDIHERLMAMRARVSLEFNGVDNQLGVGALVGILIRHAENVPPDYDWLKAQVDAAPKRGRPRSSDPSFIPKPKQRPDNLGHVWLKCAAKAEIHLEVCKRCEALRSDRNELYSTNRCPAGQPRTKTELLSFGFTTEEVAWAHG